MPIPPPSERPDLYDEYDGLVYSPTSAAYFMDVTPEHVQIAIEKEQGKPFSEIAEEMAAASWLKALMYYVVDGAVFRKIPGKQLEQLDQETGGFNEYKGNEAEIKLGMPMDIEDLRSFMRDRAAQK